MKWPIIEAHGDVWRDRALGWISLARQISANPTIRIGALLAVLPLFAGALILAWRQTEIGLEDLALHPLLAAIAFVPPSVFASTWQLKAMTRAGGVHVRWWKASRVVTLGTLSSLLPASSGTVVRGGAVVVWGVPPRTTGKVLAFDAALWTCISLLYSGVAALVVQAPMTGAAMLIAGAALVPITVALGAWLGEATGRLELVLARSTGVMVHAVRLLLSLLALSYTISFVEASTMVAAGPLAAVFFFLPAGIGVEEAFTSAIGAATGLSAATVFLAAVLNRLIGLSVILAWEGMLLLLRPLGSTR